MGDIKRTKHREANRTADTTFDRIWKYYFKEKNPPVLRKSEEAIRVRLDYAWKLIISMHSRTEVVAALMKEFGIKSFQAYNDYKRTEQIFGNAESLKTGVKRTISNEWLTRAMKKAWEDGNMNAVERLATRYSKNNGLEEAENSALAEMMRNKAPAVIVFTSDPKALENQAKALMEDVEDIEHEEIHND